MQKDRWGCKFSAGESDGFLLHMPENVYGILLASLVRSLPFPCRAPARHARFIQLRGLTNPRQMIQRVGSYLCDSPLIFPAASYISLRQPSLPESIVSTPVSSNSNILLRRIWLLTKASSATSFKTLIIVLLLIFCLLCLVHNLSTRRLFKAV